MSSNCIDDWQNDLDVLGCNKYMLDHRLDTDITFQLDAGDDVGGCGVAGACGGVGGEGVGAGRLVVIPAHRYVLVSRSPVFFAMFSGPMAEKTRMVKITDITADGFLNLLRYLYHEHIDLCFDNVFQVLYAAKKYIVTKLVKICVQFLENIARPENACLILDQSILLEDSLEERCIEIIQRHTKKVLISETFYKVSNYTLCKILKCGGLSLSEVEVFKACDKWAELQCTSQEIEPTPENKREMLGRALYLIHIPSLSIVDFTQVVVPSNLLSMKEENTMFKFLMGDESVRAELPFPTSVREFFAFTCKVYHDGCVRHSTVVTPLYDGFIRRSKWSMIFHVDNSIKLHEIAFLGSFHGMLSVFQNGTKKLEIVSAGPEDSFKLDDDLIIEAGQFTIVTDPTVSYNGEYYYKTMSSQPPRTECDSESISIIGKECTTVSLISHFTFTHSEDMLFMDDYFAN